MERSIVPQLARRIERKRLKAGVSTEELLENLRAERRRSYSGRYAGDLKRLAEKAFEVYQSEVGGAWRWRLLDPVKDGGVIAESPKSYPGQTDAEEALTVFKERAARARIETAGGEGETEDGGFTWRLRVPESGDVLAVSACDALPFSSVEDAGRAALGAQRVAAAAKGPSGHGQE